MTNHTKKLNEAGFINVTKEFKNNKPCTTYSITEYGKHEFNNFVKLLNQSISKER